MTLVTNVPKLACFARADLEETGSGIVSPGRRVRVSIQGLIGVCS